MFENLRLSCFAKLFRQRKFMASSRGVGFTPRKFHIKLKCTCKLKKLVSKRWFYIATTVRLKALEKLPSCWGTTFGSCFLIKKKSKTKQVDVYLAVHHVHKNNTPIVFITHGRQSVTRTKLRRQYFLKFHEKFWFLAFLNHVWPISLSPTAEATTPTQMLFIFARTP